MTETIPKVSPDLKDEEDLVRAAQKDLRVFEKLYQSHIQEVYRYVYSRTGSQPEAEDITAQTFLSALEGFQRYHHDGHFAAWLFSIARRKIADHYRKASRAQFLPDDFPSFERDLLDQKLDRDRIEKLRGLLRDLEEEEQELLRLRFAARLGFADIARLFGRNEDAVKKSLYRLLSRLQSRLEESND